MRRHAGVAGVQFSGCAVLALLAYSPDNNAAMVRAGVRDVATAAKHRHGVPIVDGLSYMLSTWAVGPYCGCLSFS
jgi:hypothetical protein